ncbi:MAG: hypothetical protein F2663_01680 [Actinobacteria bacterium]|uniref:Unannotated protein n=1 Tax=freshwater metagenome TaxID=449393 RepID=A0A6J6NI11_9ZZZZ|nr:hypothetical protein [Actinomycetota bacterium]
MRAARLHAIGGIPQVDDVPEPDGTDLIEVAVAGLNPVDVTIGNGRFHGGVPDVPYVIGTEIVGTKSDGRRYWYYDRGTMAERVSPQLPGRVIEVPDGVPDDIAIACGVAGLTGWLAVTWRAPVTADDTVLVLGASGSLGRTVIEGAKLLGARTIGAARRAAAVTAAADEVVEITGSETYPEATVIVDGLWGDPFARALSAAAPGVRVVQLGQSAGAESTLQSGWVRGKNATILGMSMFRVPDTVLAESYKTLATHARDGVISFEIEHYPLASIGEAWVRQASGSPGAKIVIDF